uniref:Uncharacterized protein n=1 Tax=Lepeophtheirus salmonis TaxID=72036 RepID=A0A0K2U952_LEPSM
MKTVILSPPKLEPRTLLILTGTLVIDLLSAFVASSK